MFTRLTLFKFVINFNSSEFQTSFVMFVYCNFVNPNLTACVYLPCLKNLTAESVVKECKTIIKEKTMFC